MKNLIKILSYKNLDFHPKLISDSLGLQSFNDTIDGQEINSICGTNFVIDFIFDNKKSCKISFVDEKLNVKLNYLNYYLNCFLENKDYLFFYYIVRRIKQIDEYLADQDFDRSREIVNNNKFVKKIKICINEDTNKDINDSIIQVLVRRNGCFLCNCITRVKSCFASEKYFIFYEENYNFLTHRYENMVFKGNKMYNWLFKNDFDQEMVFKMINYYEINYELKYSVVIGETEVKVNGDVLYKDKICKKRRFLMKNGVKFEEMVKFFDNCY
ncbi:hypothetical protein DMUE_3532 [Dictyocoela muelleri]|nr:hypothetical protein DMUE_3532 [Dictyocoela muelleri]